jgi:proteasome lid subunit RPN8/RPN11
MIRITPEAWQKQIDDCERCYPHEACGLLVGPAPAGRHDMQITEAHVIQNLNTERANDRFILDPREFDKVDREIRTRNLEVVGVYHSHPDHPPKPSQFDLDRAKEVVEAFGDNPWIYFIAAVAEGNLEVCRGWVLNESNDAFEEAEIAVEQ